MSEYFFQLQMVCEGENPQDAWGKYLDRLNQEREEYPDEVPWFWDTGGNRAKEMKLDFRFPRGNW